MRCASAASVQGGSLHGLVLAHNGPSEPALVDIDYTTGNVTVVGQPMKVEQATGDLGTIDSKRGIFYYLGDSSLGTTLVGLSLKDGSMACSTAIPFREIGFVGFGQSLDYDAATDELILTGIAMPSSVTSNNSSNSSKSGAAPPAAMHSILKGSAKGCGPFKQVGSFGVADYLPMIHSSTLDVKGQMLYDLVSLTKGELGIAVIDLKTMTMTKTVAEASPDDIVNGLVWDEQTGSLAGVAQSDASGAPGLTLRRLNVATGKWSSTPITSKYGYVGGNAGTLKAFDTEKGILFVEICNPPTDPNADCTIHLGGIDLATATVVTAPALAEPFSGWMLTMAWSTV